MAFIDIPDRANMQRIQASWYNTIKTELINFLSGAYDLSNKAIIDPTRLDVKKGVKADLLTYASAATNGQFCFATDEKKMYQVIDGTITGVGGGLDAWAASTDYVIGDVVHYSDLIYLCTTDHTFTASFDGSKFTELSTSAISGATENNLVTIDANTKPKDGAKAIANVAFKNENNVFSANQELNALATFDDSDVLSLVPNKMVDIRSGKNFIRNGHFEINAIGWTASSANISIARNTTTPISSDADGVITITTSATTSDYVQYGPFVIEKGDQSNILTFLAKYYTDANYLDDKLGVYFYDATNSAYANTDDQSIKATSLVGNISRGFQIPSDCVSGYIRFKVDATVAAESKVYIDNVEFMQKPVVKGLAGWKQYTLTVTGTNWTTTRAVGIPYKTLDGAWRFVFNIAGAVTSQSQNTLTINGVVFKNTANHYQSITALAADATANTGYCTPNASTIFVKSAANTLAWYISGDVELDSKPTFATDYSNVVLSEDAGNKLIDFSAVKPNGTQSASSNAVTLITLTERDDKTSSFGTDVFTAPETGSYHFDYSVWALLGATAPTALKSYLLKNATGIQYAINGRDDLTASKNITLSASEKIDLIKGDTIGLYVYSSGQAITVSGFTNQDATYLSGHKISSPQTIAASEECYAYYNSNTATSIANTGSGTDLPFEDKIADSHNAYNIATGIYTCPRSGLLSISSGVELASAATWEAGESLIIRAYINAKLINIGRKIMDAALNPLYMSANGSLSLYPVVKGDAVKINIYQNSDGAISLDGDANSNYISIKID